MRWANRLTMAAVALALAMPTLAQPANRPPYFASIAPGKARMRTGPGRTYPASWIYQRADLPVRVLDTFEHGTWVKIEDPDGQQGWMLHSLVSGNRTGMIVGQLAELRETREATARVRWRAEPNVVGRLSQCGGGWCWFDVDGRAGFVETNRLWGVDPGERF